MFSLDLFRDGDVVRICCAPCRERQNEASKKHYVKNKEKLKEARKEYQEKKRAEAEKEGRRWCQYCGSAKSLDEFDGDKTVCASCCEKQRTDINARVRSIRNGAKRR